VGCGEHDGVQLYPAWARFYQGVVAAKTPTRGPASRSCVMCVRHYTRTRSGSLRRSISITSRRLIGAVAIYNIALGLLEEGIRIIETTGERMFEAELYRLRGELELEIGRVGSGEAALTTAAAVARRQQARGWELRATAALARYWGENGNKAAARDLLAPVYGWFSEGLDAADLQRARSLLKRLD